MTSIKIIQEWFARCYGSQQQETPQPQPGGSVPVPIHRKVLVVIYNPIVQSEGGSRLAQVMGWSDPQTLATQFVSDVRQCSHGIANFDIMETITSDTFPVKEDGFAYTTEAYVNCVRSGSGFHQPDAVDYNHILNDFQMVDRINNGQVDELWLFGFPYAGFYESRMAGPGAFPCNSPSLNVSGYNRRFVIMGFNYERGAGEMLEDLGHRSEAIMQYTFRFLHGSGNLWERFTRYEKANPGQAEVGTVHYAPNSPNDYEWGDMTPVLSRCRTWDNYPNLEGDPVMVDSHEWGSGDMRLHHLWWLGKLPHVTGSSNYITNNWWEYILDPNKVK